MNKGGHDYKIENSLQLITEFSTVIGDSMTGLKHGRKLLDVENQEKLFEVIEIPIYWIAVYRNPFDVISSSALMNEQSIEKNIDYFIENINIVNALSENEKINKNLIHVYLEDLIEDSEIQLKFLVNFLGLRSSKAFTNTCKEIIFDNSNQGFYRDEWTDYEIEKVNEFIIDTKELHKYKD